MTGTPRPTFHHQFGVGAGRRPASEPVELLGPVGRYTPAHSDHQLSMQLATAVQQFTCQARGQERKGQDGLHMARRDPGSFGDGSILEISSVPRSEQPRANRYWHPGTTNGCDNLH